MWVVKNYDYSERKCDGKKGWTSKSADALYRFQTGDCRTLSVGFAFWLRNLAISVLLLRRTQVIVFGNACVGSREWKMLRSVVLQYSETKTVSSGIQGIYAETIYRQNPLYS